ncbi:DUF4262 domain-containing protein [Pseudomonas fluorescens]|uniref:DUF4262 domain-containing protein n=1 Tax=Pseudomonas fluorescens TaxID=294 RepID=UPI001930DA3F|nr:DUF4262 domain-containing protein [Pseudomonas fluorescens]MBD8088759.1 DUF4262 domain-containing protein [Pseudomonas fluorescens]
MPNPIQRMIQDNVNEHGLAIQFVFPTKEHPGPSFAYTIGMTDIGQPELLMFGLPHNLAGMVFNQIHAQIKAGSMTGEEDSIDELLSVPLLVHSADDTQAAQYTVQCHQYYLGTDKKPVFKQLLWPDTNGVYPHQVGYEEKFKEIQPYVCLDRNPTAEQNKAPGGEPDSFDL